MKTCFIDYCSHIDINYFHCLQIVEILKETEADSKSLFGRYGSQRMKDWQEVVRCYETGSVGLAEAAQLLMRNTAYEIPATKKAIVKCEQVQHVSFIHYKFLICTFSYLSSLYEKKIE